VDTTETAIDPVESLTACETTGGSATEGSVSKTVARKSTSSARKVSLTSQMTVENLAV